MNDVASLSLAASAYLRDRTCTLLRLDILPPDRRPAAVYLAPLAPNSRRTMKQSLEVIANIISGGRADVRSLAWESLRYQHSAGIRAALIERYAPATVNRVIAALKGVLKECWRLGLVSAENYHRAVDLKGVSYTTLPRGRALSSGELKALFVACANGTKAGVRDAALLAVCYAGGLRRSEAVAVDLADYLPETGALTVRGSRDLRQTRSGPASPSSRHSPTRKPPRSLLPDCRRSLPLRHGATSSAILRQTLAGARPGRSAAAIGGAPTRLPAAPDGLTNEAQPRRFAASAAAIG